MYGVILYNTSNSFFLNHQEFVILKNTLYTGSLWSYSESAHGLWALHLLTGIPRVTLWALQT